FLIAEPIVSYWSTRQIARGESVGKTSLFGSMFFAIGSIPIYLILTGFVSNLTPGFTSSLILGAILVPVFFVSQTLTGINLGHKPHTTSYAIMIFELIKIPFGLIFVFFMDLGINGAILATFLAYAGKLIVQYYYAKEKLSEKFNISYLLKWIKNSWIPLYANLSHVVWTLDVLLFTIITGSVLGVAFYSASLSIAAIVAHSGMISQALYPKLLAKGGLNHINENFIRLLYFAIPLVGLVIVFSGPGLYALNPKYLVASQIVILLSLRAFFYVINASFNQILTGMETIDVGNNHTPHSLLKSKLFFIPTITNIHYSLYIVILVIMLLFAGTSETEDIEFVNMWAWISFILSVPFAIYAGILVKHSVPFSIPIKEISKYVLGAIILMTIFLATSDIFIKYEISIYDFLPGVFLQFLICACSYLGFTYLVDKKTRVLLSAILSELKLINIKRK
ncbi:MAG: hypothetical protein ACREAK_02470, partial [Nitrosarchaeum sp.]